MQEGFPGGTSGREPASQCRDVRSQGWEDPLEEGKATLSSLLAWRIPMDRGAWRAAVHGVAESQTRPERLSTYLALPHGAQGALLPQAPELRQESTFSFLRSWVWTEALPLL